MKYGQKPYDFNNGVLVCMSPSQVLQIEMDHSQKHKPTGWNLLIHADFLWNSALASTIRKYANFDYAVNQVLLLSPKEQESLIDPAAH